MFNDRLSSEVAEERIRDRMQEAETYSQQKRLGFGDYGVAKWIFVFVIAAVMALVLL